MEKIIENKIKFGPFNHTLLSALKYKYNGNQFKITIINGNNMRIMSWYPNNGQVRSIFNYFGNVIMNIKIWYENGQVERKEYYKEGKLHGLFERWWDNGKINIRCNYKDGLQEGIDQRWYSNGQINSIDFYKDGKLQGQSNIWHKNGQLEKQINHYGDRKVTCWYDNGNLNYTIEKKKSCYWYKDGKIKRREHYRYGKLYELECWDQNGVLKLKETYNFIYNTLQILHDIISYRS